MKNIIKTILICSLFSLMSCEKDLYENQIQEKKSQKINFQQFKNETKLKNKGIIKNFNFNNDLSRDIAEEFILDTVMIKKHIDEFNNRTYSFKIYPLNEILDEKEYYNLVYEKVDNQWYELLFKITEKLNSGIGETKIEESKLVYTSQPGVEINAICSYTRSVVECYNNSCSAAGLPQCDGYNCTEPAETRCYHDETFYYACSSTGINYLVLDPGASIGGGGNVSEYEPNPIDANCDGSILCSSYNMYKDFKLPLPTELRNYLSNNTLANSAFYNYLIQNWFSQESKDFTVWSINYLLTNQSVTIDKFKNWFLIPREGKDGDYDESFWENPNLTFQQQNLPSFQAFDTAYPRTDGAALIQLIGGDVLVAYLNNPSDVRGFCALKVSRGLNGAGIIIPDLPGKTIKGEDDKYYFLNAKALNKWMRKTFGTNDGDPTTPHNPNHVHFTSTQGGLNGINFPQLTVNIKGIFSMVTDDPDHNWASGHADLINNGTCVFGCHFHDVPVAILDYIDIWKLN